MWPEVGPGIERLHNMLLLGTQHMSSYFGQEIEFTGSWRFRNYIFKSLCAEPSSRIRPTHQILSWIHITYSIVLMEVSGQEILHFFAV